MSSIVIAPPVKFVAIKIEKIAPEMPEKVWKITFLGIFYKVFHENREHSCVLYL